MKKLLPAIAIVLFCAGAFAQAPAIRWQKCYGGPGYELGYSISATKDHGYIIGGATDSVGGQVTSVHGSEDAWVVKTDSLGTLQWQKCYGGSGHDYVHSIQQTADGGYILGATTSSGNGNVTGHIGKQDYWIVKTDSIGNIQWQKPLGSDSDDWVNSIQQVRDGGYIISGVVNGNGVNVTGFTGQWDGWVVKLDANGNIKWQKCIGGTDVDVATSARQTADGGYIVVGETSNGPIQANLFYDNVLVVKMDSLGNTTWQNHYGETGGNGFEIGYWGEQTTDGGYIIAATAATDGSWLPNYHTGAYLTNDIWVFKLNSTGSILWQKVIGGSNNDMVQSIHQTLEGGYVLAGYTQSHDGDIRDARYTNAYDEQLLVKLDAVGNIEWEKTTSSGDSTVHGQSEAYCVVQNTDSSFAMAGYTGAGGGDMTGGYHSNGDIAVFKFDKTPPPCLQFTIHNSNLDCQRLADTTTLLLSRGIADSICWGDGISSAMGGFTTTHVYAQPGIYQITIADSTGCLKTAWDTIVNLGVSIDTTLFTHPSCDYTIMGQITVAATGGVTPYTYLWSNNATTASVTNLTAGIYGISVTDNAGCLSVMHYNLYKANSTPGYYVYCAAGQPNCGNNGVVETEVHNGISPFHYLWSNSATTSFITNLAQGSYSVTVTDSLGCKVTGTSYLNLNCYNFIFGHVFNDANSNCVIDSGEQELNGVIVTATDNAGNSYYGDVWEATGQYVINIPDTGTYTVTANLNHYNPCSTVQICGNSTTVHFGAMGDTSLNNNFGIHFSGYDLGLYANWGNVPPCYTHGDWEKWYSLSYFNQSALSVPGPATITFRYDSALSYIGFASTTPTTYDAATRTLTYALDTVGTAGFVGYIPGAIEFTYRIFTPGYQLRSEFWITPENGDCDTTDNHYIFIDSIFDSHDPNEKTVEPANNISVDDSVLTYTINFQNTGNDTAWFITVVDTLSGNLDPATVRIIASSIPVKSFTVSGRGILTWLFDPANLPDSLANAETSKGFVKFQIQKKKNLPVGTVISNTAAIYFDYNAAVFTNTVTDTVTTNPLAIVQVKNPGVTVRAFPNPFSNQTNIVVTGVDDKYDFELYDATGRLLRSATGITTNTFQLNSTGLADGIYLYTIKVAGQVLAPGKLVVQR